MCAGPSAGKADSAEAQPPGKQGGTVAGALYSTVTDFARLRGLSTSQPRSTAM